MKTYYNRLSSEEKKSLKKNIKNSKFNGNYIYGIEDYLQTKQYHSKEHREKVVENILDNWQILSHNSKFHAIFATSSIKEAIEYYRLFKEKDINGNFKNCGCSCQYIACI